MGATKSAALWIVLAACAGLILGLGARLAMRVVAMQADVGPEFSLGGSVDVVLFGVMVGAPIALMFWAGCYRVGLPPWSGVFVGLALFGVMAAWPPPAAESALRGVPDKPAITAALFAFVFLVYGASLHVVWRLTGSR